MPHKGDMMTVREIVETLGLAADEDAVRKMAEYNAMVSAMSRKMNLTGIKDAEESLVKNIYRRTGVCWIWGQAPGFREFRWPS